MTAHDADELRLGLAVQKLFQGFSNSGVMPGLLESDVQTSGRRRAIDDVSSIGLKVPGLCKGHRIIPVIAPKKIVAVVKPVWFAVGQHGFIHQ